MLSKNNPFLKLTATVAVMLVLLSILTGVSSARSLHKGEWIQPEGYPAGFHGWGRLDRVDQESVVIDDTQYPLAADAVYQTPEMRDLPLSDITVGDTIGFMFNESNKIESLWRIDP